jgi:hypothetical protein
MARGAADAFIDMNAVVEINEVGQSMNLHPLDRRIVAITFTDRFEVSGVIEEHRVAIHACLRRRYTCRRRGFHAGVTVAAIDAVIAHMMFVTELHGLLTGDVLPRHIR